MLTFAEELLTLIIDGENVKQAYIPDRAKRFALAGAVLMELALENRIDTDVESLYVTDPTPLGDALLDPALAEIAQEGDTRPAQFWVRASPSRATNCARRRRPGCWRPASWKRTMGGCSPFRGG